MARKLEEAVWVSHRRVWRSRSKRCLGVNREFYKLRTESMRGSAAIDWPAAWLEAWLQAPKLAFNSTSAAPLKVSKSSQVLMLPVAGRNYVYKQFDVKK